jgi:two-component system response regulator DegU
MHENRDYMLEATKAGAAGYVLKDASRNELLSAVRRVVDAASSTSQAAQPGHGVFG